MIGQSNRAEANQIPPHSYDIFTINTGPWFHLRFMIPQIHITQHNDILQIVLHNIVIMLHYTTQRYLFVQRTIYIYIYIRILLIVFYMGRSKGLSNHIL